MGDRRLKCSVTLVLLSICSILISAEDTESCDAIQSYIVNYDYGYYYLWNVWSSGNHLTWYNMTFWGGHFQLPFKDNVNLSDCFASWSSGLVVLLENHPNTDTLDDKVVTLKACSLNQNRVCQWNMDIYIRKCNGDLLYAYPWYDSTNSDTWDQHICFDRIYSDTCSDISWLYSAGTVEDDYIHFDDGDIIYGWYNGFRNGKQYVFPSTEDLDTVFEKCLNGRGYFLQEPVGSNVMDTPVRLSFCQIWTEHDADNYDDSDDNGNCFNYIYVRSCNGKLQFDLSDFFYWGHPYSCFIHKNNIFVQPDLWHDAIDIVIDGQQTKEYLPFLQYKCLFEMEDGVSYKTNWYINGTLEQQTGPSSKPEDLVFNREYLNDLPPGYEVQCGVIKVLEKESNESLSDVFFAGWKVPDKSISLTKNGFALVNMEPTTPTGCRYTGSDTSQCYEELVIEDPFHNPEVCAGGIRVQDGEDTTKSSIIVQTLTQGEQWISKTYMVKLSTYDHDYEDPKEFDLEISLTDSNGHANKRADTKKILGFLHTVVTNNDVHKNKRCYSHVDPHHKTSDGVHFEMQKPGDHMMYLNSYFQSEIQQSANYCTEGYTSGPICACGIAIRVGADAFVIDKCAGRNFTFDFVQCGDGGIIDIERINDYRYKVRTPIGTVVDIRLHTWSGTMNIDIYMSAKDYGNVVGLCGHFDGDKTNDFLHRDGKTVSYDSNRNYVFSDSWILTNEENLFTNNDRVLEPWTVFSTEDSDQACTSSNSITRKKCDVPRRSKRSLSKKHVQEGERPQYSKYAELRAKRSTESFIEDEASIICNESINSTPAVLEFPDKLAEEDLSVVMQQCVYDLIHGNDTAWVDAHTTALNDAAQTILEMNPTYVANNSELVKSFLSKTCLNNCSQNGMCTEEGLCECNVDFRGPYCSIDITIPPLVYEIQGGDICDTSNGDDCTCFQLRTNNIFEGFMCKMSKHKVYFNGTRIMENSNTVFEGDYHDIFTGVCCDPFYRRKRPVDGIDVEITVYEFSISNDGSNYGEPNSVYAYDTTCIQHEEIGENVTFKLNDDFCFIDGECKEHGSKVSTTDGCFFCDTSVDQYSWSKGYCKETESFGLKTGTIVGIAVGSFVAIVVVVVLIYILCLKSTKKKRTISQADLQNAVIKNDLPQSSNFEGKFKAGDVSRFECGGVNQPARTTFRPYIISADAATPFCLRREAPSFPEKEFNRE